MRWTDSEIQLLLSGEKSDEELAKELNRTKQAVCSKRHALLNPDKRQLTTKTSRNNCKVRDKKYQSKLNHNRYWTVEEDQLIMSPDRPHNLILSRELGRTVYAIKHRRTILSKLMNK